MATRTKDQHGPGKEKIGTPPSYPRHTATTTHSKRSPSAPSPNRSPDKKHATSETPSDKRIPNYLKPTVSSAPNANSQGRIQPASNNTTQKPTLTRRKSFEKPPSPNSPLQKSHNLVNPNERIIPRSSLNVVPKSNSSLPKPHQERFLKAHRDAGKSHSLFSSNKKPTAVKKQNVDATTCAAPTSTEAPNTIFPDITADTTPLVQCHQEDQETPVTDVEEMREIKVEESNNELPPHISAQEDRKEDIKPDNGGSSQVRAAEQEENQDLEIKTFDSATVLEIQNEPLDVHMEEAEGEEEIVEEIRKDESNDESRQEERVDGDDKEGEESATENSKDKSVDKNEEVGEGSQTDCKEREAVEDIGTETKNQTENMVGKQVKKESQAYNDVIEETASKLLEKRKNKVKALVGAFETVISLQEPEA